MTIFMLQLAYAHLNPTRFYTARREARTNTGPSLMRVITAAAAARPNHVTA